MNYDLFLYATAIGGVVLTMLVSGYAYMIHRRDFWKIQHVDDAEKAKQDLKGVEEELISRLNDRDKLEEEIGNQRSRLSEAREYITSADLAREFLKNNPDWEARRDALLKQKQAAAADCAQQEQKLQEVLNRRRLLGQQVEELDLKRTELEQEQETKLGKLKEEFEAAKKNAEIEIQSLEEKVSTENRELERIAVLIKEKNEKLSELQKALAEAESALQQAVAKIQEAAKEKEDELNAQLQVLNAEIEKFLENKTNIEKQIEALNEKLGPLNSEIKELELKRDALAGDVKRNEQLKSENERLEKRQDDLLKTNEGIQKVVDELMGVAKIMREESGTPDPEVRYADLWPKTPMLTGLPLCTRKVEEHVAFERMKNYVTGDLKLTFADRTLLAFHTALKTQMISPVTVLAGISGTGKSALPKAYAEGMGMHFVSLPVQPRWDSPQDLFGFYNYLEKRYKATELARAMVQFEQYNRQIGGWPLPESWNNGLEDRMLLVLLDEMNLARIEYYFSDFLSKLEVRREIEDPEDPEQRVHAEIALDMGSLSQEETAIRLFPGSNVLFTGTMNEDETTQTLSDKVLDRSCVLRFGKPDHAVKFEKRSNVTPVNEGLPHERWLQWRKAATDLDGSDLDRVNGWINSLNDAMNQVGRPFGYRVIMAIQSYCANYPRFVNGSRLEQAMADQVEQRIMPKLRGLDLDRHSDALRSIAEVIDGLGDRDLRNAFEEGSKPNKMIFSWQGLDRTGV